MKNPLPAPAVIAIIVVVVLVIGGAIAFMLKGSDRVDLPPAKTDIGAQRLKEIQSAQQGQQPPLMHK